FLRVGPDRLHRGRHRQRLAVAVGDHSARGRDRDLAQRARVALAYVEVVVEHLHVECAADQRDRAQRQRAADQGHAVARVVAHSTTGTAVVAGEQVLQRAPRLACVAIAAIAARVALAVAPAHGRITTISGPSGNFIPRRSRATWSIRLLSAQVACSSCNWPNAMLSSSRAFSSRLTSTNNTRWRWRACTTPSAVTTLASTSTVSSRRPVMRPP